METVFNHFLTHSNKHPVQNGLFHFAINDISIYDNSGIGEFMIKNNTLIYIKPCNNNYLSLPLNCCFKMLCWGL